jgi:hypothetical protein
MEQVWVKIWYDDTHQKRLDKTGLSLFVSDKIDCGEKNITRNVKHCLWILSVDNLCFLFSGWYFFETPDSKSIV